MANPLMISAAATGKVKVYQTVVSSILLSILPISYIVLKAGANPTAVFIVHFIICNIAFVIRLFIIRSLINLSIYNYITTVILRCLLVAITGSILPYLVKQMLSDSILSSICIIIICTISNIVSIYYLGLESDEKDFIKNKCYTLFSKFKK